MNDPSYSLSLKKYVLTCEPGVLAWFDTKFIGICPPEICNVIIILVHKNNHNYFIMLICIYKHFHVYFNKFLHNQENNSK
jgi:hypothetical protein